MPRDNSIKHVLIIGSGPIIIGQACEFDYSGTQSARSLREEGIKVSLINSNPATIMTDPVTADHIYLRPLTVESIEQILQEDSTIDAVLSTMGGQTALNLAIDAGKQGVWERHNVKLIGVDVLVEKAVLGWKEFELELLRDAANNVVIICTVENLDPMGIHTGDSITVAPAMTLSDTAYQQMRNESILAMRSLGNFAGGCNIQFSQNPDTEELIVIEINPRVSRSSALASKATGYPIAKIATKLAIGYTLDELKNQITKTTSAYFEPTLDYVIVKMPRWNFDKFYGADHKLGLQMKSVGEVMAIGRNFLEALQKACQSQENNRMGLGADKKEWIRTTDILERLEKVSDDRIYRLKDALRLGVPSKTVHKLTKIDPWFIKQIKRLVKMEEQMLRYNVAEDIPKEFFRELKEVGYSDAQIAWLLRISESEVTRQRKKLDIRRTYKMVDTCAAEFEAQTPYFYSTFDGENESIPSDKEKIIVLGSGPNRIGQGIEFDYCCVHGLLAIKDAGYEAIMINCNPETVSTDFDIADKLYFEPIFWEHIQEILELEKPTGVIVQLGGQTALKLAELFHKKGIKIYGTSYNSMDLAEDRGRFSDLLKDEGIPYPKYGVAHDVDKAIEIANRVTYPVLVRPSYVLGGQRMRIVINDDELERHVLSIFKHLPDNKVLIDQFLERAKEAEVDAICDGEEVHIMGIMEHIEPAGIHSGDSSAVLPTYSLSEQAIESMKKYTKQLALALKIKGLINIQFAIKDDKVYVIEANPRASRTTPFIAKAYQAPYLKIATQVMIGTHKLKDFNITKNLEGYAIKVPVFSFNKFPNVDKNLGPEMKSTGEAIRFIKDLNDPFFRELDRERSMFLTR